MTGPWDADWVSFTTTWSGVFVFLLKFSGSSFESKNLGQSWSFSNITCGAGPCWSLVYSLASRTNIFLRMVSYIMWKFLRKVSWSFSWSTVLQRKLAILYQEAFWYESLGRVGMIIYTPIPPIATDASKTVTPPWKVGSVNPSGWFRSVRCFRWRFFLKQWKIPRFWSQRIK